MQHLIDVQKFNLKYLHMLADDLTDKEMTHQPGSIRNHPAWQLGHLANTCDFALGFAGAEGVAPQGYKELFGGGSQPTDEPGKYPSRDELFAALEKGHAALAEAVVSLTPEQLAAECPVERMRERVPTVGGALAFIMAMHEGIHIGQLSAWRRAAGKPALF